MSRSRKIVFGSIVCAAFLAIGIGCTVEERNIEEANVFVCNEDKDCLEGSVCVFSSAGQSKRCVPLDQVSHCYDMDGDGYYVSSDPAYDQECGFSDSLPKDPDDNNALIYPGAPELCDGVDNSNDGCTDGICPDGANCKEDSSKCVVLSRPCWGSGHFSLYDNSPCSQADIGLEFCKGKEGYVFGHYKDGKFVEADGACPKSTDEIKGYKEEDVCFNKIDDNCNGQVDEGEKCRSCNDRLKDKKGVAYTACTVTSDGVAFYTEDQKTDASFDYITVKGVCGDGGNCPCTGTPFCESEQSDPVCKNGSVIDANAIADTACYKTFENN